MFAKMKAKPTLIETYEEAKRVEAERESVEDYPDLPGDKTADKRVLVSSKPREEHSHDLEGMMKTMQKLYNRIIDLEKERDIQKTDRPYYSKREDNNHWKIPSPNSASINITEIGGDNFCTFHQQPHSEKKCPQWLNSMSLVMNKLLDSKLTEDSSKKGGEEQTIEKGDDDAMLLWNGVSLFNIEEDALKSQYTPLATKDKNLEIKGNAILPKVKNLQGNVRRQVAVNVKDNTPEATNCK